MFAGDSPVLFVTLHALVSKPLGCMGVRVCMLEREAWDLRQSGLWRSVRNSMRGSTARTVMQKSDTSCTFHLSLSHRVPYPSAPVIQTNHTLFRRDIPKFIRC